MKLYPVLKLPFFFILRDRRALTDVMILPAVEAFEVCWRSFLRVTVAARVILLASAVFTSSATISRFRVLVGVLTLVATIILVFAAAFALSIASSFGIGTRPLMQAELEGFVEGFGNLHK